MPRPIEFDRAQALTRALHLFWERGYERTTLRDLTETMGISAPSLYNTFRDKEHLYGEALAEYERSGAVVVPQAVSEQKARDVFARVLDIAIREYTSAEHPHGCFVQSDPLLGDQRKLGRDMLRDRLQQAHDEGDLPEDCDVDALADYTDIFLRGLSSLARDGADSETLRAAADVAIRAWPGRHRNSQ